MQSNPTNWSSRRPYLAIALVAGLVAASAQADVLHMPAGSSVGAQALPVKGESMGSVVHRFGEPAQKFAPVGGDSPRHPPITRWDYSGYSVFFEHSHVISAVVPGQAPTLYHTEELRPPRP